ncbi:uncharacterized protein EV154DRAFT_417416 [Mucor mucedo]|uniref:uncharacterized protein n=1 Tax=Mucor mucedo TaxID=29922 RepID=UPI002220348D|nr:uncharacterized protein EV154DRAFT_417416 [Mucor mucedo]KAI7893144.1 hypothetical protein EV154DRAFT_417416 [Mucor mucedo]
MNNLNYDTFHNQLVESPSTYYPTAIPPDPLQRYGSGHLDQDIFGIAVSRLSNAKQMGSTRSTLLSIFTVLMALVVSNIASKLVYEEAILVIVMSGFGLVCSLLYTFQNKYYFRGTLPFVCSLGAVCLSSPWLRYVYDMDPLEILFPITVASIVCIYIILELYYIMKVVTSDDYLLANIYFYVDLVYPMRFIHHFCELTDNMNIFPEILYPGDTRV